MRRSCSLRRTASGCTDSDKRGLTIERDRILVWGRAEVAELVDALDSGSSGHCDCGGSTPPFRTQPLRLA